MRTNLTPTRTLCIALLMLIPWMRPDLSPAADQVMGDAANSVFRNGLDQISAGSVEDTLTACLARIPKDASDGQRLLAVNSCKQEDVVRTLSKIDF